MDIYMAWLIRIVISTFVTTTLIWSYIQLTGVHKGADKQHHYRFSVTHHHPRESNGDYLTDSVSIEPGAFHFTDSEGVERWIAGDVEIKNNKEKK